VGLSRFGLFPILCPLLLSLLRLLLSLLLPYPFLLLLLSSFVSFLQDNLILLSLYLCQLYLFLILLFLLHLLCLFFMNRSGN
jgi:L-cystine uptake protein TcyP (sodium:dicarboxylate symporter family)